MENARQFDVNLYRRVPGDRVTLAVRRGSQPLELAVSVVARPEDTDRFLTMVTPEKNLIPRLGVLALELDDELLRATGSLRGREGVLVAARSGGSDDGDDLRPGDVVSAVRRPVLGLAELRSAWTTRPGQPIVLRRTPPADLRGGGGRVVPFTNWI
jgi:S1-C subfamily serine protease